MPSLSLARTRTLSLAPSRSLSLPLRTSPSHPPPFLPPSHSLSSLTLALFLTEPCLQIEASIEQSRVWMHRSHGWTMQLMHCDELVVCVSVNSPTRPWLQIEASLEQYRLDDAANALGEPLQKLALILTLTATLANILTRTLAPMLNRVLALALTCALIQPILVATFGS